MRPRRRALPVLLLAALLPRPSADAKSKAGEDPKPPLKTDSDAAQAFEKIAQLTGGTPVSGSDQNGDFWQLAANDKDKAPFARFYPGGGQLLVKDWEAGSAGDAPPAPLRRVLPGRPE